MKKKVLAVSAACALSAATAVPALALENEFHGMFRVFGTVSNYNDGGSGQLTPQGSFARLPDGTLSTIYSDAGRDQKTRSFVEQRARLMYIAKANDDLKLVTHFEIDTRWGDNSYANGRNSGGAIGADTVNLETKNVYLDFNIPGAPLNFKVGIQPLVDSYKGIFFITDAAGAVATYKRGAGALTVGWSRFDDAQYTLADANTLFGTRTALGGTVNTVPGKATRDLYIVDGKYNVTKDIKVGGSYYVLTFDQDVASPMNFTLHNIGVNAEWKLDPVTIDGFVLYQTGRGEVGGQKIDIGGWAANVAAKAKVGPGTLRAAFLYASGDKDANGTDSQKFIPVTNETSAANGENSYYESGMMIMMRNKYNITGDRAVVYNISNVFGGFIGYDANITSKAFASVNAGFLAADKKNDDFGNERVTAAGGHDSSYLGTEINAEVGYKLYDNLTASLQGAYVVLGDYYKDTVGTAGNPDDPRDPYLARVMLNYAF